MKYQKALGDPATKSGVIVNIFAEAEIKAEISVLSHENVVVIPYLVNSKDKNKPYVDIKMIEIIREIIGC